MDHKNTNTGADEIRKRERVWSKRVSTRAALVVAHPGHELRVYDWLQTTQPDVHVLTNGSRSGMTRARREASAALVSKLGCRMATAWDGVADAELYALLFAQEHERFFDWVTRLAADLVERDVDLVIADAWQYYNIAHDLTHLMARVAAAEASARTGREIAVLEFPVVAAALAPTAPQVRAYCSKALTDAMSEAKRRAAHQLPGVEGEVEEIETLEGAHAYGIERFFTPAAVVHLRAPPSEKPPYEVYGEARVASGVYPKVLRWRHAAPLIRALADRCARAEASARERVG